MRCRGGGGLQDLGRVSRACISNPPWAWNAINRRTAARGRPRRRRPRPPPPPAAAAPATPAAALTPTLTPTPTLAPTPSLPSPPSPPSPPTHPPHSRQPSTRATLVLARVCMDRLARPAAHALSTHAWAPTHTPPTPPPTPLPPPAALRPPSRPPAHPHPVGAAEVQLAIILYGDGGKIANPIGVFRNNSNVDFFYWGLINISPDHRTSLANMQLACLCMNEDLKRYGPLAVLCGTGECSPHPQAPHPRPHPPPDEITGEEPSFKTSTSFGCAMQRLNIGFDISVPARAALAGASASLLLSAFARLKVKGWVALLFGDSIALAEFLALKKSMGPMTHRPCRRCTAQQVRVTIASPRHALPTQPPHPCQPLTPRHATPRPTTPRHATPRHAKSHQPIPSLPPSPPHTLLHPHPHPHPQPPPHLNPTTPHPLTPSSPHTPFHPHPHPHPRPQATTPRHALH